jgi:hypothetical protein
VIRQPDFPNEREAKAHLERLLRPYFALQREARVRHLEAGNYLRIDYLGRPRPGVEFPFSWFGLECKRSCKSTGDYNAAIAQAIHYTHCVVDDDRPLLERINGQRIERVYVFPARGPDEWFCNANDERREERVQQRFLRQSPRRPASCRLPLRDQWRSRLYASADRQWSVRFGPRAAKHNSRQLLGNGALRRDAPPTRESINDRARNCARLCRPQLGDLPMSRQEYSPPQMGRGRDR